MNAPQKPDLNGPFSNGLNVEVRRAAASGADPQLSAMPSKNRMTKKRGCGSLFAEIQELFYLFGAHSGIRAKHVIAGLHRIPKPSNRRVQEILEELRAENAKPR
jgi:hypothetical protein